MTRITVKLTLRELDFLTTLASDQLFRREFIDPRMPGYKSSRAEVDFGKRLIARLRSISERAQRMPLPNRNGAAA